MPDGVGCKSMAGCDRNEYVRVADIGAAFEECGHKVFSKRRLVAVILFSHLGTVTN